MGKKRPVDIVDRYPEITIIEISVDECDSCEYDAHVQAYVYAVFKSGTLALCGHCATEKWEALTAQAIKIIDHRHLIPK